MVFSLAPGWVPKIAAPPLGRWGPVPALPLCVGGACPASPTLSPPTSQSEPAQHWPGHAAPTSRTHLNQSEVSIKLFQPIRDQYMTRSLCSLELDSSQLHQTQLLLWNIKNINRYSQEETFYKHQMYVHVCISRPYIVRNIHFYNDLLTQPTPQCIRNGCSCCWHQSFKKCCDICYYDLLVAKNICWTQILVIDSFASFLTN